MRLHAALPEFDCLPSDIPLNHTQIRTYPIREVDTSVLCPGINSLTSYGYDIVNGSYVFEPFWYAMSILGWITHSQNASHGLTKLVYSTTQKYMNQNLC